ncbi:MAG TPA: amylo-alpha-1,6-glucosidase [Patescibacteria group bacterium]|nr:amylo-alpha-1,6-glucosidase [Patescibacteria group bacterium]
MADDVSVQVFRDGDPRPPPTRPLSEREWLVTNGRGGYASGTVGWANNWRYHGPLISAEAPPLGRMLMLRQIEETIVRGDGRSLGIAAKQGVDAIPLAEFRMEDGIPVWRYAHEDIVIERVLFMPYRQNSSYIVYRLVKAGGPVTLELRPYVQIRPHDASNDEAAPSLNYVVTLNGLRFEVSAGFDIPTLRLSMNVPFRFTGDGGARLELFFGQDAARGYTPGASAWNPGTFSLTLTAGQEATLIASTEEWRVIEAIPPAELLAIEHARLKDLKSRTKLAASDDTVARLTLAAEQFVFEPVGRVRDEIKAKAFGEAVRAIIAGYHWFTDWGRDTFISLEGLTLTTGRTHQARWILMGYGTYIKDGLVPNLFPEGAEKGLYHTADASLWYFHALDRYLAYTNDRDTLRILLQPLLGIAQHHLKGTKFGIEVDPQDGLLRQGEDGYQLTWMDAKVGDWVVTPRRGKAVEINALWYNALRLLSQWLEEEGRDEEAKFWANQAETTRRSFNERFWFESGGYLYDVVDGPAGHDAACRPNQIFSFSLRHPILDEARREAVLRIVQDRLLTPMGLRTLEPGHPDYKPQYFGDLRARDAAYHQGTVWPWLIGPFIDAWLTEHPGEKAQAHEFLSAFPQHLNDACIGSVSEICDAEAPFTPRGCIAQAWSVAEVLRAWIKTSSAE